MQGASRVCHPKLLKGLEATCGPQDIYISTEIIIRNPKKVGLFGSRYHPELKPKITAPR